MLLGVLANGLSDSIYPDVCTRCRHQYVTDCSLVATSRARAGSPSHFPYCWDAAHPAGGIPVLINFNIPVLVGYEMQLRAELEVEAFWKGSVRYGMHYEKGTGLSTIAEQDFTSGGKTGPLPPVASPFAKILNSLKHVRPSSGNRAIRCLL